MRFGPEMPQLETYPVKLSTSGYLKDLVHEFVSTRGPFTEVPVMLFHCIVIKRAQHLPERRSDIQIS